MFAEDGGRRLWRGHSSAVDVIISERSSAVEIQGTVALEMANLNLDIDSRKTYMRRFVEKVLMNFNWYYPGQGREGAPDLKKGWLFFEQITLPRRVVNASKKSMVDPSSERVEPGEELEGDTELFNFFSTPSTAFNSWGVGISLYFSTLRTMALALFLAGLISLPNAIKLDISATCEEEVWAKCDPGLCDENNDLDVEVFMDVENSTNLFVKRSNCDGATSTNIAFNFASIMFLVVATILFGWYQTRKAIVMDEDKLTCSDYSLRVLNPPKDAIDPEEWRDFFSRFTDESGGITLCTITVNNSPLLRALLDRRYFRAELKKHLRDTDIDNEEELQADLEEHIKSRNSMSRSCIKIVFDVFLRPIVNLLKKYLRAEDLVERIKTKTAEVKELQRKDYNCSSVFVTFETEIEQRRALKALNSGKIHIKGNGKYIPSELLFRDTVLDVIEPCEPSAVRYLDLETPLQKRVVQRLITMSITVALIALSMFLVQTTRESIGPFWAGILTAVLNMLIPLLLKLILLIEHHATETSRQKSLYIKMTSFRWINTAIAVKFLTPFTSTLDTEKDSLLPAINGIFVSEIFLIPFFGVLDIMGNVSRHIFAPRATTTHQMLLCFKGMHYNLADKYTDLSKILFLSYFYCALDPLNLFKGFAALILRYYADKFCMLRIWKVMPDVRDGLANYSRRYFFSLAIVVGAVVSAYDWSQYPFDGICEGISDVVASNYTVNEEDPFIISILDGRSVRLVESESDGHLCKDRWKVLESFLTFSTFTEAPRGQVEWSRAYRSAAFLLVIGYIMSTFGLRIWLLIKAWFIGTYRPVGKVQNVDFSSELNIDSYIPQIVQPRYAFPILACDIDEVDQNLIGWNDPLESYDDSNIIFDMPYEGMKRPNKLKGDTRSYRMIRDHPDYNQLVDTNDDNTKRPVLFDIVKHWPPY